MTFFNTVGYTEKACNCDNGSVEDHQGNLLQCPECHGAGWQLNQPIIEALELRPWLEGDTVAQERKAA